MRQSAKLDRRFNVALFTAVLVHVYCAGKINIASKIRYIILKDWFWGQNTLEWGITIDISPPPPIFPSAYVKKHCAKNLRA